MTSESRSGSTLSVEFQDYADCRVVTVSGRVDHTNSTFFLESLSEHADAVTGGMVIDLSGLEFITSAGLRTLLMAQRTILAKSGRMAVAGTSGTVREVFRISKFDTLLTVAEDVVSGVARVSDAARAAYPG